MQYPENEQKPHNPRAKEFSLGVSVCEVRPAAPPHKTRRYGLSLLIATSIVLVLIGVVSLTIGARFTQSLHFENRTVSFFEGMRIVGGTLLGTSHQLRGESDGRINILLLGRAGEHYPGRNLTDTVMLLSIDTQKKRVGLLSLPRDLFVPISQTGLSTKLNSLYQIGLSEGVGTDIIRESVSYITGQPIHYYAMINFDGFERMVNALGGIRVEVLRDISDEHYPGKNYSYETFVLKKGWQLLDGQTALKYARERHNDPEGDFGRAKRQQQIMQAIRDKVWSLPTLLNPFTLSSFLESLGESVTTDIAPEEVSRLVELAHELDTQNISTTVVDAWKKESLLRVSHVESGGIPAFILIPRSGTWDEIRAVTQNLFEERNREQRTTAIQEEAATIIVLTSPRMRRAGESLVADMRASFPLKSVRLETSGVLDDFSQTAMIQGRGGTYNPFTIDALISRYGLTLAAVPSPITPLALDADIIVVYQGPALTDLPTLETISDPAAIQVNDFQEPLPPQKNPFTR